MSKKKVIKVIDLFAGVGGFRVGLSRANKNIKETEYKFVWGNQWEPGTKVQIAASIYKDRFKVSESEFANTDINLVKTKDIPNHNMIVAGFPCQDYSVATTKKLSSGIEGKKGVLWWQIERILREKKENSAEYFIFENVDRLLKSPASQRGRDFAIMLTCLNNLGYMVEWRVVDASTYGFPQRRKRLFFIGYKKGTKVYDNFNATMQEVFNWLSQDGVFAKSFPVKVFNYNDIVQLVSLPERKSSNVANRLNVKEISDNFNLEGKNSPFLNAGIMKDGFIFTTKVEPNYKGKYRTLGDILLDEKDVPEDYFIPKEQIPRWEYLKGAKHEARKNSITGHEYKYSEGAITYPDSLERASRTIITGEGGSAPSRFKHVVKTESGRLRRLTPIELERLDMFDDNHTNFDGATDTKRAFLMGNALVVGVVKRIGEFLYKKIE